MDADWHSTSYPHYPAQRGARVYDRISRGSGERSGQPLKIRIEVLAIPMGELPLDEVASQPPEANQPVLVHSCRRLGHSANPPDFRPSFADWLRPLALPLSAGASALRRRIGGPVPGTEVRGGRKRKPRYNWRRYADAWSPHGEVMTCVPFDGGRTGR